jgi:uncharacterized membrane protein
MRPLKAHSIIALITVLAGATLAVLAPPTKASISVESTQSALLTPERKLLSAKLGVLSAGDPYLRITPDSCVFAVVIDGVRVDDPQVPFCAERNGRSLFVGALSDKKSIQVQLEMEARSSDQVTFTAEHSAWKVLTLGIFFLSSFIFGSLAFLDRIQGSLARHKSTATLILHSGRSACVVLLALWTLLYYRHGGGDAVQMSGVLGLDCYLLWLLFRRRVDRDLTCENAAEPSIMARLALTMVALAIFVLVGSISTIRHYNLGSHAFDLAIQENVLWNSLHGNPFISSVMGGIPYLGNHTVIAYVLLLPFYYLLPSTYTLLWLQAAIFVATVVPLFLVARYLLRSERAALLVSFSFLLHPALLGASCNDFHELALAPCSLAWLMYAVVFQRPLLLGVMALMCSSIKEDMSVNLIVLGAGLLATRYALQGVYLLLCGVASYVFWQNIIIPAFAGFESTYTWYLSESLGRNLSPIDVVRKLLEAPFNVIVPLLDRDRAFFLLQSLGGFLFTPVLSLRGALMTSYGTALVLLSGHAPLYTLGYHYVFAWLTIATFAYLLGLMDLHSKSLRTLIIISVFLWHLALFIFFGPIYPLESFRYGPTATTNPFVPKSSPELISAVKWARSIIPESASVVTSETLAPHFATRERIAVGDRVNAQIRATFNYCLEPRINAATTCSSLGCKGTEVPNPYPALLVCKQ